MSKAIFKVPTPVNEKVKEYKKDSEELKSLLHEYDEMYKKTIDVPMIIGGNEVTTQEKINIYPPHDINHCVGHYYLGNEKHVEEAIEAALQAKVKWSRMKWQDRASIFLKAADLLTGPFRDKLNAATMIGQSKNVHQAEIDAACELIDFLKFNVKFMTEIYENQPISDNGMWNRMEYRPLEGFIFALTPFNFTSICANLCAAPALMGNVIVWKPARTQIYSAKVIMDLFKEAGLPDGVINMITVDGSSAGDVIFKNKYFAGLHFTGSTNVFNKFWEMIGKNIDNYISYPRIVGETGGKDFIVAHKSCEVKELNTAIIRGSFEFQGQKCSASSRVYVPKSKWKSLKEILINDLKKIKIGSPRDTQNFMNAVISEQSFKKITEYIEISKNSKDAEIIFGGEYEKSKGYFIQPTVVLTSNADFITMKEEIFGPLVTIFLYEDNKWTEILKIVDSTSKYALTGAVFSKDRYAIEEASEILQNSAGNFYINDKPTGAVVGQQPFGGSRASGTNDKAGSSMNLYRWVSARTIKETFNPPKSFEYGFMKS